MELTVQNVYGLLLRSKLLSLDEARAMFARWQEEAREAKTNLARFAQWMVANKYLTEYQAALLARGHAEGFFLGEYKILDRLGKGRMAGVYKAQHRVGGMVAIKVLPPSKARDATLLARFQREARLSIKLRHPNIVRVYQMGVADGLHYLVMEHLEGETLEEVLARRGKLLPAEAVRVIYQALQGLQHIHAQGLVHRDLKPANLMLIPPPGNDTTLLCTVKVLDIGLGRGVTAEESHAEDSGLTTEGVLLGTPDYMAPEQARDPRTADIRSDIYSLGCVLYQLLAGQVPFPDTNIISQMIRHATEQARSLRELNPAVPEGLEKIVGFLMAKDPAARYATPERAAQALEVFLTAGSAPVSSPDLDPGMQPYLTWVEAENKKGSVPVLVGQPGLAAPAVPPPGGKPPSGVIPAASPPAVPAALARPAKTEKPRDAARRKARKARRPPPIPGEPPEPASEDGTAAPVVDVELVPVGGAPGPDRPSLLSGLTRRDLLVFSTGVVGGVLAVLIGRGLAALFPPRKRPPPEPEQEPAES